MRSAISGLLGILLLTSCTAPFQVLKGSDGSPAAANSAAYSGLVLGLDGKPATGVTVRGHIISNNGSGLIGIYGSKYRIQSTSLETRTDASGRFTLNESGGEPLNIEAVLSEEVKAIQLNVANSTSDVTLQLAYTGSISGRVTAPSAPGVSNFEGVDVFIPGTSYVAKTTSEGHYVLSNVAAGRFSLVASKQGLGRGNLHGVKVFSKQTTSAPDLELSVAAPVISSVLPASGGRGSTVTIQGGKFGASTGEPFSVVFGGATATSPQRLDDQTLTVVVPSGASSGDVVVTVGGISSNLGVFTVIENLFLGPNLRYLGTSKTQAYTAWAKDSAGRTLMNPAVQWSVEGPISVAEGRVSALGQGPAVLTARSGDLMASLGIQVVADSAGVVNTFAGSKDAGYKDDWGPQATFNYPHGVAVDVQGNLFVADRGNHRIRKITPDGIVSTYAGTGDRGRRNGPRLDSDFTSPVDLVFDKDSNLYVTEEHGIRKITPEGEVSSLAGHVLGFSGFADDETGNWAAFSSPHGIAYGPDDHLYVADYGNHAIRRVSRSGAVTTLAGSGGAGFADATRTSAQFNAPIDVAVDATGNVYVTDSANFRIRRIEPDGAVSTFAGGSSYGWKAGFRTDAIFYSPHGLAIDPQGILYVTDRQNHDVRKIGLDGMVTMLAGNGFHVPSSLGLPGFSDGSADGVTFEEPFGICLDGAGRVFIGDRSNNRIRVITP